MKMISKLYMQAVVVSLIALSANAQRTLIQVDTYLGNSCSGDPIPGETVIYSAGCNNDVFGSTFATCTEITKYVNKNCQGEPNKGACVVGKYNTNITASFKPNCINGDWYKIVQSASEGPCPVNGSVPADAAVIGYLKGTNSCTIVTSGGSAIIKSLNLNDRVGFYSSSLFSTSCAAPLETVNFTLGKCFVDPSALLLTMIVEAPATQSTLSLLAALAVVVAFLFSS